MNRVLFVSNGHGESAIAERIAREVAALSEEPVGLDQLALVGEPASGALATVGPRRAMPSGGLVAMGNLTALARDIGAGFLSLAASQIGFLRAHGRRYDCVVAVGDVYALAFAGFARRPVVFVGTAKSISVTPYGPLERKFLSTAARAFVRDAPTAAYLRAHGVAADAPGNVIVELADEAPPPPDELRGVIGVLPGSRETAYADAVRLCAVIRALAERRGQTRAVLSVAGKLSPARFAGLLADDGRSIEETGDLISPFRATAGEAEVTAWRGPLGTILNAAQLIVGLAGTANEQAAAAGVPIVVLDVGDEWYRMRQRRLLGDALTSAPVQPGRAAQTISDLLADEPRLARMRAAGQERMGPRGGSRAIAAAIIETASAHA
jgi:uncharacterized protein (TIGR03492 family)